MNIVIFSHENKVFLQFHNFPIKKTEKTSILCFCNKQTGTPFEIRICPDIKQQNNMWIIQNCRIIVIPIGKYTKMCYLNRRTGKQ